MGFLRLTRLLEIDLLLKIHYLRSVLRQHVMFSNDKLDLLRKLLSFTIFERLKFTKFYLSKIFAPKNQIHSKYNISLI